MRMCYLQSLIYKFLGLDVAGCGDRGVGHGLRTIALCKRLHVGTTVFSAPANYPGTLGTLGDASGVLRVVAGLISNKKKTP